MWRQPGRRLIFLTSGKGADIIRKGWGLFPARRRNLVCIAFESTNRGMEGAPRIAAGGFVLRGSHRLRMLADSFHHLHSLFHAHTHA